VWDASVAALRDATDAKEAQPAAGVGISVAQALDGPEPDERAQRLNQLAPRAARALCTPDVAPSGERSCAAEAPRAERRTESESAQGLLARKKAREKPQVAPAELEAPIAAAVPWSQPPELALMSAP
jgi:hypothetical protein